MINDEQMRTELQAHYEVLVRHNLYRRGYIDMETTDDSPKELGQAIDAGAGAILEYIKLSDVAQELAQDARYLKSELKQQEAITTSTIMELYEARAEIRRLQALLARHRIKYKKG